MHLSIESLNEIEDLKTFIYLVLMELYCPSLWCSLHFTLLPLRLTLDNRGELTGLRWDLRPSHLVHSLGGYGDRNENRHYRSCSRRGSTTIPRATASRRRHGFSCHCSCRRGSTQRRWSHSRRGRGEGRAVLIQHVVVRVSWLGRRTFACRLELNLTLWKVTKWISERCKCCRVTFLLGTLHRHIVVERLGVITSDFCNSEWIYIFEGGFCFL